MEPEEPGPPLLIPPPRSIKRRGAICSLGSALTYHGPLAPTAFRLLSPPCNRCRIRFIPGAPPAGAKGMTVIEGGLDDSLGAEDAYHLNVNERSISIRASSTEGVRHALVTLAQLIAQFGRTLPTLEIEDRPLFATRGVMLDISRCRVPTMAQLYSTVDALEGLRINHLQLYTEHTFAYVGHEAVWRDASPITPDEMRELDAYCAERGIDLAANQNTLGHITRWLTLPAYRDLAEIPDAAQPWTFLTPDGRRTQKHGPFSLCPTDPRSIDFVRGLLDQLLPCVTSGLVNIGCDEAHDVGQGRSKQAVAQRGYADVYADHVRAVDQIAITHTKRTMFWADMALAHPEALKQLPNDAVALAWGYEGDTDFAAMQRVLVDADRLFWVCPGTSSWRSITGRTANRHANLARAGECTQARGMLICDWGDEGHRQHWPIALHAIAHGAHMAWCGDASTFDPSAASLHILGDDSMRLGVWLEALGRIDQSLVSTLSPRPRNANALYEELHRPLADLPTDAARSGSLQDWESIRSRLDELRSELQPITTSLHGPAPDELEHTLRQAEHAADKAIVCRAQLDRIPAGPARIRLAADLASISQDHRDLWHARSRPGGLDESAAWFERVIDDYEHPDRNAAQ